MFYAVIGIAITGGIIHSVGQIIHATCLNRMTANLDTCLKCCPKVGVFLTKFTLFYFIVVVMIIPTSLLYFYELSHWTFSDSFYFTVETTTTIGFGDLTPKTLGVPIVQLYVIRVSLSHS